MQTLPVEELKKDPVGSLWHLHIQPPMLDLLRALLLVDTPDVSPMELAKHVDRGLYALWAVVYALLIGLVCCWVSGQHGVIAGTAAGVMLALHPAALMYATLLDGTLLSTLGTTLLLHLLWRVYHQMPVPAWAMASSFLFLYFTRSIFQWPWLVLLTVCLLMMGYGRHRAGKFLLLAGIPVLLFAMKQHFLFGTATTSTFTGYNLCRSIGVLDTLPVADVPTADATSGVLHPVLSRPQKADGSVNYNHWHFIAMDRALRERYRGAVADMDLRTLLRDLLQNLRIYLKPSSRYTAHAMVDRIPWRSWYDAVASHPILSLLLGGVAMIWWRRTTHRQRMRVLGLCLPLIAVVFISVVFEKGENMRFKFFVEPALFVFIFVEGLHLVHAIRTRSRVWSR